MKDKQVQENPLISKLFLAISCNDIATVNRLIKTLDAEKVSLETQDQYGCTPLHIATQLKDGRIAKALIDAGANVNAKHSTINSTPLHYAASNGLDCIIDLLVDKGADKDAQCTDELLNSTPLHYAVKSGRTGTVDLLLRKGVKIELPDKYGNTPLGIAVSQGHTEIVEALIKVGANVNYAINQRAFSSIDPNSQSILKLCRNDPLMTELLLKYGALDLEESKDLALVNGAHHHIYDKTKILINDKCKEGSLIQVIVHQAILDLQKDPTNLEFVGSLCNFIRNTISDFSGNPVTLSLRNNSFIPCINKSIKQIITSPSTQDYSSIHRALFHKKNGDLLLSFQKLINRTDINTMDTDTDTSNISYFDKFYTFLDTVAMIPEITLVQVESGYKAQLLAPQYIQQFIDAPQQLQQENNVVVTGDIEGE